MQELTEVFTSSERQTLILALSTAIELQYEMLETMTRDGARPQELRPRERHLQDLDRLRKRFQVESVG